MENNTLTVSQALIALGNGEKITSDGLSEGEYIKLEGHYLVNNQGIAQKDIGFGLFNCKNLRIYEEFTYPMWFKSVGEYPQLIRYDGIDFGECLESRLHKNGDFIGWVAHDKLPDGWQQVEEPKKMIKVAKYAFDNTGVRWFETDKYFKDDEDFKSVYSNEHFKRLDYTEIEVEEMK